MTKRPSKRPKTGGYKWQDALETGLHSIREIERQMTQLLAHEQAPDVEKLLRRIKALAEAAETEIAPLLHFRDEQRESEVQRLTERVEQLVALLEDGNGDNSKIKSINDRRKQSGNG